MEYRQVTLVVDGKQLDFPTGKGGELYLENIKAGHYAASFTYAGKACSFAGCWLSSRAPVACAWAIVAA